jgi:ribosomal protein S18 acetylase RimI-like enzyme
VAEGGKRKAAVIRPAGTEDYEHLAELLLECLEARPEPPNHFLPEVLGALRDYGSGSSAAFEALLAEVGGPHGRRKKAEREPAVGFALYGSLFWPRDLTPALFVKELYVQPAYRGEGLGRALMASLARIALQRQWKRLFLAVDLRNEKALAFYRSLPGSSPMKADLFGFEEEALFDLAEGL